MARRLTGLAPWKPTGKSLAVVQVALGLSDEWPLPVRRVMYVAYERGLYPAKGKAQYDAVGNALGRAHRAGLLPWEAIADTTERVYNQPYDGLADFAATVRTMASKYRLDRQEGQPRYLVVWSEHRGLRETLADVASDAGVPFIPAGGYDATAVRYAEARAALERGVPTVVLHLSDLDRHGGQITDLLRRDLASLYRDIRGQHGAPELVKIALTEAQARDVYPDRDGWHDIQVDALPTPMLQNILREAIASRTDDAVLRDVLEREAADRAALTASARRWST
jgi:hypothetical protein